MSIFSNLGEINLGEWNLGDYSDLTPLELSIEDSFELTDSSNLTIEIPQEITEDLLDNWNDLIELTFDTVIEISDALEQVDSIQGAITEVQTPNDLNFWQDEVIVMPGEFVELSYDTMMYDFLDSIEVDLRQHRGTPADSFTLSDSVIVSLGTPTLFRTSSDSLNNWNDTVSKRISVQRILTDDLSMYDGIKLKLTQAKSIGDSLSLSDAIQTKLSTSMPVVDDSLDLWNDLVNAELKGRLSLTVTDAMSQSDALSTESELGEDLTYYRRYLNDVIS